MHLCCIKQGRNVIKRTTQTLLHAIAQHSRVQKQGFFSDSSKTSHVEHLQYESFISYQGR